MKLSWTAWTKLAVFCTIGLLCGVLVVNTLSVPVHGETVNYVAQFERAEGLNVGNPVMMNGIRIGRISSIRFADNPNGTARADVGLEVTARLTLSADVSAAIRYGDMLGARYVALSDPGPTVATRSTGKDARFLPAGGTIALAHTTPAVDLTALLNGFKPLFDALQPDQVNALTRGLTETFAGQGQTLGTLLTQLASATTSMDNNKYVFSTLVANLSRMMKSVNARQPKLRELVVGLQRLTTAVNGPDGQLGLLLDQSNAALATLAATVATSSQEYGTAITDLNSLLGSWQNNTPEFEQFLAKLPQFSDAINRSTSYGGFVSLYLCNFTLKIAKHEANIFGSRHSEVCLS